MTHPRILRGPALAGLLILAFSLALQFAAPARAGDTTKPPMAFRDRLYDVKFLSETEAVAVGYPGKIFRTSDAGRTWELIPIDTREPFFAVDFADAKTGFIVGRKGLAYKSADGGKTWSKLNTGIEEYLFDVDLLDANHGIAVGNFGTVALTSDGGATWTSTVLDVMASATIYAVQMIDAQAGYLAGEYPVWEAESEGIDAAKLSSFFKTKDGGKTWERVAMPDTSHIFGMAFKDANHGYVVGTKGLMLKTEDGGATWKKIPTGTESHLLRVTFDGDRIFALGNAGVIVKVENDKGAVIPSGAYYWFSGLAFNKKGQGILVGDHGLSLTSDDGGKTWK